MSESSKKSAGENGLRVIGKRTALIDGRSKSSGDAVYTDDIQFPGCLVGKILRSPLPHARILKLDVSAAGAMPSP